MTALLLALWSVAHVAGIGVVAIGVIGVIGLIGPRPLHWLHDPWWWVVVIILDVSSIASLARSGRWVVAGLFVGVAAAAFWFLREAIATRRVRRILGRVPR